MAEEGGAEVLLKGNYTDYLGLFGDYRTAHSDLAARLAAEGGGGILILLDEAGPCGYLCQVPEGEACRLQYIFVLPGRRKEGHARSLLLHAMAGGTALLRLSLPEQDESFAALSHLAQDLGFQETGSSVTFHSGTACGEELWGKLMEGKGRTYQQVLERMGFGAYSFREAPRQHLDSLYASGQNEYGNSLEVRPYFDMKGKCLDWDLSFLAVHREVSGEKLAAYSLVTRPDAHSAVFEQMSAAQQFQHTGCVVLPVLYSMAAFYRLGLKRAAYTMYEDNAGAHALRRKLFGKLTLSSKPVRHFIWQP